MRLIDADALKIRDISPSYWQVVDGLTEYDIEDAPTVDAVPVIRCRDCIYWKRYCRIVDGVTSNHVCGRKRELDGLMHRSKADDFCSWAKRRNDETN